MKRYWYRFEITETGARHKILVQARNWKEADRIFYHTIALYMDLTETEITLKCKSELEDDMPYACIVERYTHCF